MFSTSWRHSDIGSWTLAQGRRLMKVYLAGPFGFSEAGRHFQEGILLPALCGLGLSVVDP